MVAICINVLKELFSLRTNIFSLDDGRNCDSRVTTSMRSSGGDGAATIEQGPQRNSGIGPGLV